MSIKLKILNKISKKYCPKCGSKLVITDIMPNRIYLYECKECKGILQSSYLK